MKLKEIANLKGYAEVIEHLVRKNASEIRKELKFSIRKAFLFKSNLYVITDEDKVYLNKLDLGVLEFNELKVYPLWRDLLIVGVNRINSRICVDVKGSIEDVKKFNSISLVDDLIRIDITENEQFKKEVNDIKFEHLKKRDPDKTKVLNILKNLGCFYTQTGYIIGKHSFDIINNYVQDFYTNKRFKISDSLEDRLKKFLLKRLI